MSLRKRLQQWAARRYFLRWPRRAARYPVRVTLTQDLRHNPRELHGVLRQAGYTHGDRVVVLLEDDLQRIIDVARRKANGTAIQQLLLTQAWASVAELSGWQSEPSREPSNRESK